MDVIYIINQEMWNGLNRIWNTVAIPVRMWWTIVTTTADLANTLLYNLPKEGYEILSDTTKRLKDVLLWAWNHGKWYHKAMNIPLSPIIAGWTALEWAVRATVQPIINWIANTWNTGVNTVKNARRWSFGRLFSKKPISDFSYEHLKTRPLTLNNWFSKLQFARWKLWWWGKKEASVVAVADKKEEKSEKKEKNKTKQNNNKKDNSESDKKNDEKMKEDKKDKEKWEKEKDNKLEEWYKKAWEILKDTKHGSKIFANIRTRIPNLEFIFDENSSVGSVVKETNKLTVGMKMPSDEKQIAPLNEKKDNKEQIKHVLLHEIWHIMIGNHLWKAEKALNISKSIFEKDENTLTPLAQLWIYKTSEDKAKEDLSEMIALYANRNENLDKYLSKLTSDKKEDEEYRKKFKLAKISKEDASTIKDACKELVKTYS